MAYGSGIIARKTKDKREQTLDAHLNETAAYAELFGQKFGAGNLAKTAALYHDIGKSTIEFQEYIRKNDEKRGKVKHSIHGAKYLYKAFEKKLPAAELLANCVLSHHGHLRDFVSPDGETPLYDDLKENLKYEASADGDKIDFQDLIAELNEMLGKSSNKRFALTMAVKLIYSCLVDADRLDAYLCETKEKYTPQEIDWAMPLKRLEAYISDLERKDDNSNPQMKELRRNISLQCAEAGKKERGVYRLEVATGGGKTLASLRFAMNHVKEHKMSGIIFVIPYLSITEQTAEAIRKAIGDENMVFEHHSNVVQDDSEAGSEDSGKYKLHTDRWDSPIIITTQVQFLESVFSAKGSDLRKLHNMADRVIIFDEAQSIPIKCIHLFNCAVNFLNEVCKTTVLLCTATQPPFDKVIRKINLSDERSIADCGKPPERYKINDALKDIGYTAQELADFVIEKHNESTLIIVNTKRAAKELSAALKEKSFEALHLSTNMCAAHREAVITKLRDKLRAHENCICVSTQLIEAGVDISFECVIRDIAGLDSIFQAAGRCNRHGEFGGVKDVFVINVKGEDLSKLPDIKKGALISKMLFNNKNIDINEYYRQYFEVRKGEMDYSFKDEGTIYDLLTNNALGGGVYAKRGETQKRIELHSAIKSAADEFYVIDKGRIDVVVPYKGNNGRIESDVLLDEYLNSDDIRKKCGILKRLSKYTVSLFSQQYNELEKSGAIYGIGEIKALTKGFYDEIFGINPDGKHELIYIDERGRK